MVGGEVAGALSFGFGDRGRLDVDDAAEGPVNVADDAQGGGQQCGDHYQGDALTAVVLAGQADAQADDGDGQGGEQEPEDGAGDAGGGLGQEFLAVVGTLVVGGSDCAFGGNVSSVMNVGRLRVGWASPVLAGLPGVGTR